MKGQEYSLTSWNTSPPLDIVSTHLNSIHIHQQIYSSHSVPLSPSSHRPCIPVIFLLNYPNAQNCPSGEYKVCHLLGPHTMLFCRISQCFDGTCWLHLQGWKILTKFICILAHKWRVIHLSDQSLWLTGRTHCVPIYYGSCVDNVSNMKCIKIQLTVLESQSISNDFSALSILAMFCDGFPACITRHVKHI